MAEEKKTANAEEEISENKNEETEKEDPDNTENSKKEKKSELKKLKAEVEELKKKIDEESKKTNEINDKYLRLAAEYDNFRKRNQKERENIYGDAVSDTLTGLLPLIDNLRYASNFSDGDLEKFADGVKLILNKLPETLDKIGVKSFGTPGDTFDPLLHNAVMHVEDEAYKEGEIIEVLQCGYTYGSKVIRYAMVKVAN